MHNSSHNKQLKNQGQYSLGNKVKHCAHFLALMLLAFGFTACHSAGDRTSGDESSDEKARTVIEVTAQDYTYRGVPDSIPAGWTTLRMKNKGSETHNLELLKLPDTVTTQDFRDLNRTYRSLHAKLEAGRIDTAELRKRLPAWSDSIEAIGGLGHLSPGRNAALTLDLRPGTYGMYCFLKNQKETSHLVLGMTSPLKVTTDSTGASRPEANNEMRIAGYGIEAEDTLSAGRKTIAVHFGEVSNPEESPFHDLELARLPEGTSVDTVAAWASEYTAPAPTNFLGGVIPMPAGETGYLTVDLNPGRYAWVSDASIEKGMMKTFIVE